jgi:hypothetical protein
MAVLLPFLCFFSSSASHPPFDLYALVPGNWTQVVNNISTGYPFTQISTEILENQTNVTTYTGEYKDLSLQITVTSNTTARIQYGDSPAESFDLEVIREADLISHADSTLADGTHLMFTFYSSLSFEISITPPNGSEILSYGFFKRRSSDSTWVDFALPIGIALILTFALHRFLPRLFG